MNRKCGDCQLCCRLVPVPAIGKPATQRCQHQSHAKGCRIYPSRPFACIAYSCRWLTDNDTTDLRRPDRAHYLIDPMPEFVRLQPGDGSGEFQLPVIQIWCDPKFADAHRDPALREYLERRSKDGYAAVVRYGSADAFVLFPPSMTSDAQWHEKTGQHEKEHSVAEILDVLNAQAGKAAHAPGDAKR